MTPRSFMDVFTIRWLTHQRTSPIQPTSKLSPISFIIWFAWIVALFFTIDRMIPVELLSLSVEGMNTFASQVSFQRLDGTTAKLADVTSLDDVVAYERALISALLPAEQYGHVPIAEKDKLYLFHVHRLINSIIVGQRRVPAERNCAYTSMQDLYPECYGDLSEGEMTSPLQRPNGQPPHEYDPVLEAYLATLPLDRSRAMAGFDDLVQERFWDRATRQTSIRFVVHNANGHYSGYGMVVFHLSPFGLVTHDVTFDFLRLQPYADVVQGSSLVAMQVVTLALLCMRVGFFILGAGGQPHKRWTIAFMLRAWAFVDYLIFCIAYHVVTTWVRYVNSRRRTSVDTVDSRTNAAGFQDFVEMSEIFKDVTFYLSILILTSTLRLLEYTVLVRQLRHTYVAVSYAMEEIAWFFVMFCVVFSGFVLCAHVLFGAQVPQFSEINSSASNLMLWLLTLGGGQHRLLGLPGGWLFMPLFLFVCLVLIFNILLALLLGSFEHMEEKEAMLKPGVMPWEGRPGNHRLADAICDSFGVSPYHADPYRGTPTAEVDERSALMDNAKRKDGTATV